MSETKFTKGEWKLIKSEDYFDDGELVISMASHNEDQYDYYCKHKILIAGTSDGDEEAVANANLIAAAPEMYNELQSLLDTFNHESKSVTILDVMRIEKLLAKARGEK